MVDLPDIARFWLPADSELPLLDRGFMPDPRSGLTPWVPDAREFEEIAHIGCLILIGEPGLGKTTALGREVTRLHAEGELVHCVDLSSTQDEATLRSRIFGGPAWDHWHSGERVLHLILDSLDFALIRLDTVVEVLRDGLSTIDAERLVLRLACRTAERQADLESWLRRHWGADAFAVYELAPLRFRDVEDSAQVLSDPAGFVEAVVKRGLQPLAMTPMTLRMLLELALNEGALPSSRRELYERGCLRLCDEIEGSRSRARRRSGEPTVAERFAVAQRLGGLLLLSAAPGVPVDAATVATMAGGFEINDQLGVPTEFVVGEHTVRDVLGSGLFANVGGDRLHFAHQTYGEFLCGRWLANRFTDRQLDDLLFAATDSGLRVIPQLRETAGWVAAYSPAFAELLVERDPAVLLRADPFATLSDERPLLVDALLRGVSRFELGRFDLPVRMALEHLKHPLLAEQLRATLSDSEASDGARETATDIAVACALTELEGDLLALAHDHGAAIRVRAAAAGALTEIGSVESRRGLVDLATDPPAADQDDELKGAALAAAWPSAMTLDQLLSALTTPKRLNLYGNYKRFLHVVFPASLRDDQLAEALGAAATWPDPRISPMNALADAREQLALRALEHLDRDDVVAAYAQLILGDLSRFGVTPNDTESESLSKAGPRRRLTAELVALSKGGDLDGLSLATCRPPLVRREDVGWLVERLSEAVGTDSEKVWAQAAEGLLFDNGVIDEQIFEARDVSPELHALTAYAFDAVQLETAEARQLQERYRKLESIQVSREERTKPRFDIQKKAADAKTLWDDGDLDGYWAVMGWLAEFAPGRAFVASDPRQLPGWEHVDETIHRFLYENAAEYLRRAPVKAEEWFDRRVVSYPAWSAYRAFRLLYETDRNAFDALEPEVWARWAPIIVGWPRDGEQEAAFNDFMVGRLVDEAPAAAALWLDCALGRARKNRDGVFVIRAFSEIRSAEIEEVVLRWAKDRRLVAKERAELVDHLLKLGSEQGLRFARRLVVPSAVRAGGDRLALAAEVAAVLVAHRPDAEWNRVWPLFSLERAFGERLVAVLASDREFAVAPSLTERQVEDLFGWLEERYPHREDPDADEVHWIGQREVIGYWRDGLLQNLVTRGTPEAVAAFDRLWARFPHLVWLRAMRARAAEAARRAEWVPPDPAAVLAMAQDAGRRWITSDDALQSAVVEGLDDFARRLGGRQPQAATLWDTTAKRPKSEPEIGGIVASFLTDALSGRGIFLAQEVEVRASKSGKGRGESVDIWVEAVIGPHAASSDRATVVVELKGCWNRGLMTAMKDQLVDRYLDPPLHRHGIYLVGCFGTYQWVEDDDRARYRAAARHDIADLRRALTSQAEEVNRVDAVAVQVVVFDGSLPPAQGPAHSRLSDR